MRPALIAFVLVLAACTRTPKRPFDDLAARLPPTAAVLAGLDVDRLRATPLYLKLPESLRDASYAVLAYDGRDLVTATRVAGRVSVSGAEGAGAPRDLLDHAPDAPLWIVARGSTTLPLAGNLANINRLLRQTDYTVLSAIVADRIEIRADAFCATPDSAQHLEENVRALGSLLKFPLDVTRDGKTVHVQTSVSPNSVGKLF